MGGSKVRYQIHKEEDYKDSKDAEYKKDIGIDTNENKRGRVLTEDKKRELENLEVLEAIGRRVYDPFSNSFDHGNLRCTDLGENKKVTLPKPCSNFVESSIKVIKQKVMKVFND